MASDKFHKSVTVDTEFLLLRVTTRKSSFLSLPPSKEDGLARLIRLDNLVDNLVNLSRSTYLPLKNPYIDPCNDTFTLHLARGSRNGHYSSATSSSRAPYQFD